MTVGSLNILDKEPAYDAADLGLAEQIADLVALCVQRERDAQVQQKTEHSLPHQMAEEEKPHKPINSSSRI